MIEGMGRRIKRARRAAGKSRSELAAAIGTDERTLSSYEADVAFVPDQAILGMSKCLKIHPEFFFRDETVELGSIKFHNSIKPTKREFEQIVEKITEKAERLINAIELFEKNPIPEFSIPKEISSKIKSLGDVQKAAETIGKLWGIEPGQEIIRILEAHGILVFDLEGVTAKCNGVSTTVNGLPAIAVHGQNFEQQQRALAHELGHLILKDRLDGLDEEAACNAFAGVFSPKETEDWEGERALDKSHLLEDLTWRAFKEDIIPSSVAARLLGMSASDFQDKLEKAP